jgi:hypothetical protein
LNEAGAYVHVLIITRQLEAAILLQKTGFDLRPVAFNLTSLQIAIANCSGGGTISSSTLNHECYSSI